jgi:hypothetical protein
MNFMVGSMLEAISGGDFIVVARAGGGAAASLLAVVAGVNSGINARKFRNRGYDAVNR